MKKTVRTTLSLLLALVMVISFAACSNDTAPAGSPTAESPSPSASQSAPASPSPEASPEATDDDQSYTSLDDYWPYDADNKLVKTGRNAIGQNGVIASDKYEASKIGVQIIEDGGNAFDAAVAVAFALGVSNPAMCGPGGGGFMTVYIAETKEAKFINFREKAPAAATPEMWELDADGKVVNNEKEMSGKSQGVPGTVAGMMYILENYGTMDRETVLQPAIDLANNGITVTPVWNSDIDGAGDRITIEEFKKLFLKDGLYYDVGDIFKNPDYAKTLELIKENGKDGLYKGELAEAIIAADNKYNGVMTMEDLASYEVTELEPVRGTYRGYEIISSPAPSSGGTIVVEILNILENFDMGSYEQNSAEHLHLLGEAYDLAYSDRNTYMGDPNYVDVPLNGLIDKDYAKLLADTIDLEKATEAENKTEPWDYEHENTNHFSIADKDGNMVAVTFTNNYYFGSGIVVDGYGFVMNNEMDDFVAEANHPNSIAGGKIPLSSMSPTIVLKDGKPAFVVGSPGGRNIIGTVAQVLINLIDYDMDVQDAVNAPRIYYNEENSIRYEETFEDASVFEKLKEMGHEVEEFSGSGSANCIKYLEDGTLEGAGDPRRDSKALGF